MITVLGRRNSANVQKVMWTLGELDVRQEDAQQFPDRDGRGSDKSNLAVAHEEVADSAEPAVEKASDRLLNVYV